MSAEEAETSESGEALPLGKAPPRALPPAAAAGADAAGRGEGGGGRGRRGPQLRRSPRVGGRGGFSGPCYGCGKFGHMHKDCPEGAYRSGGPKGAYLQKTFRDRNKTSHHAERHNNSGGYVDHSGHRNFHGSRGRHGRFGDRPDNFHRRGEGGYPRREMRGEFVRNRSHGGRNSAEGPLGAPRIEPPRREKPSLDDVAKMRPSRPPPQYMHQGRPKLPPPPLPNPALAHKHNHLTDDTDKLPWLNTKPRRGSGVHLHLLPHLLRATKIKEISSPQAESQKPDKVTAQIPPIRPHTDSCGDAQAVPFDTLRGHIASTGTVHHLYCHAYFHSAQRTRMNNPS